MNTLQPVSVALKYGFIGVLYLFLLWVARSALRDLRADRVGRAGKGAADARSTPPGQLDGTGLYSASSAGAAGGAPAREPRLVVERAPGHTPGMIYDIGSGAVLGRGDAAEIRLEDPFASARHAEIATRAGAVVLEDLGSTNGTYLNEELLQGPAPLHVGDRVRIGDSEFTYQED